MRSVGTSKLEVYLFIWLFNDTDSSTENITSNEGKIKQHIIGNNAETKSAVLI